MKALLAIGLVAALGCSEPMASMRSHPKKLVVIGVDGMDPDLLKRFIAEGRTPNLAAMAEAGTFSTLGTTNPPQSPVAWSSFITGLRPEGHGIYDFVHRDLKTMEPYLSTSRTSEAEVLDLGAFDVPISAPEIQLLREGTPFWRVLEDHGVPATVVKIPANFPAVDDGPSPVLAGMGVPDIMSTYGTFQVFTNDPGWTGRKDPSAGKIHALKAVSSQRFEATLLGPSGDDGKPMSVPVELVIDDKRPIAVATIGDQRTLLMEGEWSEWLPVEFDGGLLVGGLPGIVRLYLRSAGPHVFLYASPINLDPANPINPISSPESYAPQLASSVGRFYTQGMAQDTKALAANALTDAEFLAQAELVYQERLRLLDHTLASYRGGALFFYFSTIDQVSHVFYRTLVSDASPEDRAQADVIPTLYERVDHAIGEIIEKVGDDATIIVMSDHGFSHYRYKVHLNSWLAQSGYLALLPPGERGKGTLGHIDWKNTQAYALGLNQLFLNLKGRERDGAVSESDRKGLIKRLQRDLLSWRDQDTGARVVRSADAPPIDAFVDRRPDLLIGYADEYRSSDSSATGQVGSVLVERNRDKWSGDHCWDPRFASGVILSPRKLSLNGEPSLVDLAPTILSYFDAKVPGPMKGRNLLQE